MSCQTAKANGRPKNSMLFFGLPLAFAVWQLIVTQRAQRAADKADDSPIERDD